MKTPSQIIHAECGSPRSESCIAADGRCWLCAGELSRGEPVDDWNGASFTGQNRVRSPNSTHVCEACVFICSRLSPVPNRPAKEGKKFGGNFRNYSHLWEEGTDYSNASKGEKPKILVFLAREHRGAWFAAIADSGQKHVIPWAPLNGPGRGGSVLFEEQIIRVPESPELVDTMTALLTAGATKEELGSGDYSARAWQLCGAALREFEDAHGLQRGGGWFGLALWLAQRDEETVQRRVVAEKETKSNAKARRPAKGKAQIANRRGAPSSARRISSDVHTQHPEALGHAPAENAERVANVRDSRRVDDDDRAQDADRLAPGEQRTLFG